MDYSFDEANDELDELRTVLDNGECSTVYIEKPFGQNKTDEIKSVIREYERRSCWLNCLEVCNFNHLFGTIVNKLLKSDLDLEGPDEIDQDYLENMNINNLQNFVDKIKSKAKKIEHKNAIVILENAEIIAEQHKDYIQFLFQINQLIENFKFIIVLISSYKLDHFHKFGIVFNEIYSIEFKPHTLDEINELILTSVPDEFPLVLYSNFVKFVVQTLLHLTRDFDKLRYICEKYFPQWLDQSQNDEDQRRVLMKQREFVQQHYNDLQASLFYQTNNKLDMICELTYVGKCLLISAYLASYNSQSTDKRFFSKFTSGKQSRKQGIAFTRDKQVLGPGKFTFERLYQIYSAIQDQSEAVDRGDYDEMKSKAPTNLLFEQFRTFISQRLVLIADSIATHSPYSSSAKYMVADFITSEFVKEIAFSIGIEIDKLLEKNLMKC